MGNLATPEALLARWDELCRDPSLRNLPYKIELNAWGKVEMSPASDVVWASTEFMRRHHAVSRAYFAAGATEVWHVAGDGSVRLFDRSGERRWSRFPVTLALPDPNKGYP